MQHPALTFPTTLPIIPAMTKVECKYRIKVDTTDPEGVSDAMNNAAENSTEGMFGALVFPQKALRQTFKDGLCEMLTVHDIGPVECRQPNHNEKTCPDIAHLRESA